MNDTQKKFAIAGVLITATLYIQLKRYQKQVVDRFPDLDPKVSRKAYNNMLKNAFMQKYTETEMQDNASMDELFLKEYALLIAL